MRYLLLLAVISCNAHGDEGAEKVDTFVSPPHRMPAALKDSTAGPLATGSIEGDFNGDGREERVWLVPPTITDTAGFACAGPCNAQLHFSDAALPPIPVTSCISGDPVNLGDLDGNGSDEIGLWPGWFSSCWSGYRVWTYTGGSFRPAIDPVPVHCIQEDRPGPIVEKDPSKKGYVRIHYSQITEKDIEVRTRSVRFGVVTGKQE